MKLCIILFISLHVSSKRQRNNKAEFSEGGHILLKLRCQAGSLLDCCIAFIRSQACKCMEDFLLS